MSSTQLTEFLNQTFQKLLDDTLAAELLSAQTPRVFGTILKDSVAVQGMKSAATVGTSSPSIDSSPPSRDE